MQRTVTKGKGERAGSWDRRQRSPLGLVVAAPTSPSPRKRSRESGARQVVGGAGQASLVRVKLKTGSWGKYKPEPSPRQRGAVAMQPRGSFYTRQSAHHRQKSVLVVTRWKLHPLRTRPAVCGLGLGLPHTQVLQHPEGLPESIARMQKMRRDELQKLSRRGRMFEDGQSADLLGDATDSQGASFSLVYGQTTSTGAMVGGRKKDAI